MRTALSISIAGALLATLAACATVEVQPIEVKPIHVTVDVNVHVQRDLEDFFAFEREVRPATQPTTQKATTQPQ